MITCRAFAGAVGHRLLHITARCNLPRIESHGLQTAHDLAVSAQVAPAALLLRSDRLVLKTPHGPAQLNHQNPIRHGLRAAERVLDGHSPLSWAEQLDRRVFFWPAARGRRFASSIARDTDIAVLELDARRFCAHLSHRTDLSPINSGNFTQGGAHARRGDWLYVPWTAGLEHFRTHRLDRGLVRGRDAIVEISVRGAIDAETLKSMICAPSPLGDQICDG